MKDLLLNLNVNKPNMKFGEMVMTEVKDQLVSSYHFLTAAIQILCHSLSKTMQTWAQ